MPQKNYFFFILYNLNKYLLIILYNFTFYTIYYTVYLFVVSEHYIV